MDKKKTAKRQKEFQVELMKEVKSKLIIARNHQVLLDADVARIFGVETRLVNLAVKNNPEKFHEEHNVI